MALKIAGIIILPTESLEMVAEIIGGALGLKFVEDISGNYEEFPAFVAFTAESKYSLLGIPLPENQFSGEPVSTFTLLIDPLNDDENDEALFDISEEIVDTLRKLTELQLFTESPRNATE